MKKTMIAGLIAAGLSMTIAGCATYTGQTNAPDDPNRTRNVSRSAWQFAAESIALWYSLPRQHLAPTVAGACAFATWTTVAGAQAWVWPAGLRPHLGESPAPNAPRSLSKRSVSRLQTGMFCQLAKELRLGVFVLLVVEGFHGVAYPVA